MAHALMSPRARRAYDRVNDATNAMFGVLTFAAAAVQYADEGNADMAEVAWSEAHEGAIGGVVAIAHALAELDLALNELVLVRLEEPAPPYAGGGGAPS